MDHFDVAGFPAASAAIQRDSEHAGFRLASEPKTGSLLRTLAASKRSKVREPRTP